MDKNSGASANQARYLVVLDISGSMGCVMKHIVQSLKDGLGKELLGGETHENALDMITFNHQVYVHDTIFNYEQFCKFLDGLAVGGLTSLYDSMRTVQERDSVVNYTTIFFQTDGDDTSSTAVSKDEFWQIMKAMEAKNKLRMLIPKKSEIQQGLEKKGLVLLQTHSMPMDYSNHLETQQKSAKFFSNQKKKVGFVDEEKDSQ